MGIDRGISPTPGQWIVGKGLATECPGSEHHAGSMQPRRLCQQNPVGQERKGSLQAFRARAKKNHTRAYFLQLKVISFKNGVSEEMRNYSHIQVKFSYWFQPEESMDFSSFFPENVKTFHFKLAKTFDIFQAKPLSLLFPNSIYLFLNWPKLRDKS